MLIAGSSHNLFQILDTIAEAKKVKVRGLESCSRKQTDTRKIMFLLILKEKTMLIWTEFRIKIGSS